MPHCASICGHVLTKQKLALLTELRILLRQPISCQCARDLLAVYQDALLTHLTALLQRIECDCSTIQFDNKIIASHLSIECDTILVRPTPSALIVRQCTCVRACVSSRWVISGGGHMLQSWSTALCSPSRAMAATMTRHILPSIPHATPAARVLGLQKRDACMSSSSATFSREFLAVIHPHASLESLESAET